MDVWIGVVELLVRKLGLFEDKNHNFIGTSPHNFRFNLHQNNPLKLVVLRTIRLLITNWLASVNELWHHWRDSTNAGMKLWRLQWHSIKECQRKYGTMRRMQWYISLRINMYGFKNKNVQPGLCAIKKKSQNLLDKIFINEPSTIETMKCQSSVAPQLGTLKVWIPNDHFLYCYVLHCLVTN